MVRVHEGDAARTRVGRTLPERAAPVRMCVGCRHRDPSAQLLRVVVLGDTVVPDPRRRMPGRGAWLHLDPGCLRIAERRRAFLRALRAPGPLDTSAVHAHVEQWLRQEESRDLPVADSTGKQVDPS